MNNINILLSGTFYSGELSVGKKRRVGGWVVRVWAKGLNYVKHFFDMLVRILFI